MIDNLAIDSLESDSLDALVIATWGQHFHNVKAITRFQKTPLDLLAPARYATGWAATPGLDRDVVEPIYHTLITRFIDEELQTLGLKLVEGVE